MRKARAWAAGWVLSAGTGVAAATLPACGGDTGAAGACAISGCGGNIEGTWVITGMCIKGTPSTGVSACDSVAAEALAGAMVDPNGTTMTFSNGTYTENGTVHLAVHYTYTNACLMVQGGAGASEATCSMVQSRLTAGGFPGTCRLSSDTCACDVTQDLSVSETGTYRVAGNSLVFDADAAGSPFCVHGDTAQVSSPPGMGFSGSVTISRKP